MNPKLIAMFIFVGLSLVVPVIISIKIMRNKYVIIIEFEQPLFFIPKILIFRDIKKAKKFLKKKFKIVHFCMRESIMCVDDKNKPHLAKVKNGVNKCK